MIRADSKAHGSQHSEQDQAPGRPTTALRPTDAGGQGGRGTGACPAAALVREHDVAVAGLRGSLSLPGRRARPWPPPWGPRPRSRRPSAQPRRRCTSATSTIRIAAHRDKPALLALGNGWRDPAESVQRSAWTEHVWHAWRPYAAGAYVNFLDDEGAQRVRDAYGPETYARLAGLKRRYDPRNLFRLNQNIPPAARERPADDEERAA